jgi:DNA-binding XRE family transcriptional regulator
VQNLQAGKLNVKSITHILKTEMNSQSVGTYLRFLRKRSGLSQRDLAEIIGTISASDVSRHERSRVLPSILTAFGYQTVFGKTVSDIFPGAFYTVRAVVKDRLRNFERERLRTVGSHSAAQDDK